MSRISLLRSDVRRYAAHWKQIQHACGAMQHSKYDTLGHHANSGSKTKDGGVGALASHIGLPAA
eukprot:7554069-Pyramimonas_sp.AAC.1